MAILSLPCSLVEVPSASVMEDFWSSAHKNLAAALVDDVGAQVQDGIVSGQSKEFTTAVVSSVEQQATKYILQQRQP